MPRSLSWPPTLLVGGLALALLVMATVIAVITSAAWQHYFITKPAVPAVNIPLRPTFFAADRWQQAQQEAATVQPDDRLAAIVVPHHLLAAKFIGGLFARAASQAVQLVVVIGPNHDQIGPYLIATANANWETPFGVATTDQTALTTLESSTSAHQVPELFASEHAAGAMMPFIKTYFPNAQVIAVMYRSEAGQPEAQAIDNWLATLNPKTTRVVYSIDFSHYLSEELASRHDTITLAAITSGAISDLSHLGNGYIDSPATIMTALLQSQRLRQPLQLVYHGNSNQFSPSKFSSTTSYFGFQLLNK